jgi:hypothetical protein
MQVAKDVLSVLADVAKIIIAVGEAILTEGAEIDVKGILENSIDAVKGTVDILAVGYC